ARGDRGLLPVRPAGGPGAGGRPPAVDRALDGHARGRLHHRPGQPAGHAPRHRLGAGPPREAPRPRRRAGLPDRPVLDLRTRRRGAAMAAYNAANEEAVEAFFAGDLGFLGITGLIRAVLEHPDRPRALPADGVEPLLAVEAWARRAARQLIPSAAG